MNYNGKEYVAVDGTSCFECAFAKDCPSDICCPSSAEVWKEEKKGGGK